MVVFFLETEFNDDKKEWAAKHTHAHTLWFPIRKAVSCESEFQAVIQSVCMHAKCALFFVAHIYLRSTFFAVYGRLLRAHVLHIYSLMSPWSTLQLNICQMSVCVYRKYDVACSTPGYVAIMASMTAIRDAIMCVWACLQWVWTVPWLLLHGGEECAGARICKTHNIRDVYTRDCRKLLFCRTLHILFPSASNTYYIFNTRP